MVGLGADSVILGLIAGARSPPVASSRTYRLLALSGSWLAQ